MGCRLGLWMMVGGVVMVGLVAAEAQGAKPSAMRDIKVEAIEGKAPADYVATHAGKAWGVVIGIDEYAHVPRLSYAVADAEGVSAVLREQGFQVTTLTNQEATRRAILEELGDSLVERVGPDDRVVIFFAGHGETKQAQGGRAMGYLLPVDGEQRVLSGTAISMGVIRELANALPAKHVLFLVDVCYGGIAGQQFRSLAPMTVARLKQITRERGRQLITAGGADQRALEGPEWGHSAFTYYLLEGLGKGMADLNDDGIIPASELYTYLEDRVFDAAHLRGHTQRPELWALAAEKGEFVFVPGWREREPSSESGAGGTASSDELGRLKAEQEKRAAEEEARLEAQRRQLEEERRRLDAERERMEQEKRVVEEKARLEARRRQLEEERRLAEERRRAEQEPIEEARVRPYDAPQELQREVVGKDGAPMMMVPAGEFIMGTDDGSIDEAPAHSVYLDSFLIDKFEITNRQYRHFTVETRNPAPLYIRHPQFNGPDQPVVGVTWMDAQEYCRWAGKRLPTEAEWEKAARGTDGRVFPWGNSMRENAAHLAKNKTSEVGMYPSGASIYGAQDLAGNVWEWVHDWYDRNAYQRSSAATNPKGPRMGGEKVIRGGSWWEQGISAIRVTKRHHLSPDRVHNNAGFRCALSEGESSSG